MYADLPAFASSEDPITVQSGTITPLYTEENDIIINCPPLIRKEELLQGEIGSLQARAHELERLATIKLEEAPSDHEDFPAMWTIPSSPESDSTSLPSFEEDWNALTEARKKIFCSINLRGSCLCAWHDSHREVRAYGLHRAPRGYLNCGCTHDEALFEESLPRHGVGSYIPGEWVRMQPELRNPLLKLLQERYGYRDGDFERDPVTGDWLCDEEPAMWEPLTAGPELFTDPRKVRRAAHEVSKVALARYKDTAFASTTALVTLQSQTTAPGHAEESDSSTRCPCFATKEHDFRALRSRIHELEHITMIKPETAPSDHEDLAATSTVTASPAVHSTSDLSAFEDGWRARTAARKKLISSLPRLMNSSCSYHRLYHRRAYSPPPPGYLNCQCTHDEALFEESLARHGVGSYSWGKHVQMDSALRNPLLKLLQERYGYRDGDFERDPDTGDWLCGEEPAVWEALAANAESSRHALRGDRVRR